MNQINQDFITCRDIILNAVYPDKTLVLRFELLDRLIEFLNSKNIPPHKVIAIKNLILFLRSLEIPSISQSIENVNLTTTIPALLPSLRDVIINQYI